MIRDFSREELAPAGNDTEVTLGIGSILAIGCGLFLVCGICFGLGYAVGHRSSPDPGTASVLPAQAPVTPVGSGTKPGAAAQIAPQATTDATVDGNANGTAQTEQTAMVSGSGQASGQAEVKPAVDTGVHPAMGAQVQGWMVQIAALSNPDDAQVLVDALRKRGYEVTARRGLSDNLIHVQTGPFVNRNDANAIRQRLLNDGYNASVQ